MAKLSASVLAGGKNRRMDFKNKSFLVYKQHFFLDLILTQLNSFEEVFISVRDPERYKNYNYPLIKDEILDIGPLGGLHTSLKYCKNDYLFICATDMPLIKKELVDFMLEFLTSEYDCFVIQSSGKIHPLCGIYRKSVIPTIENMIKKKNYKLTDLLKQSKTKYIQLKYSCFDESVIANINTKFELLKLKKPAVICVSGLKNSGKTTLIVKLITILKDEGYKIGVIKHDGHEFKIDSEDTDTYKYRQAGSKMTLIYSKSKFVFFKEQQVKEVDLFLEYFKDTDLVIIEGLKNSTYPKIEVLHEKSVCDEKYLLAVATSSDSFKHEGVKTINRDDAKTLADLIKRKVLEQDDGSLWA